MTRHDHPNGKGFVIHGITGNFQGKMSAWFWSNGDIIQAEQIVPNKRVRSVKPNGPMWKLAEKVAKTCEN